MQWPVAVGVSFAPRHPNMAIAEVSRPAVEFVQRRKPAFGAWKFSDLLAESHAYGRHNK
jgi:hypothetical protein